MKTSSWHKCLASVLEMGGKEIFRLRMKEQEHGNDAPCIVHIKSCAAPCRSRQAGGSGIHCVGYIVSSRGGPSASRKQVVCSTARTRIHWLVKDKPRKRQQELGRDCQGGRRGGPAKNSGTPGKECFKDPGKARSVPENTWILQGDGGHANSLGTE